MQLKTRQVAAWVASWLCVAGITVALLELTLRLIPFFRLQLLSREDAPAEEPFFSHDDHLGWSFVPNSHGRFTNGMFVGNVHIDSRGVRQNGSAAMSVAGASTIFMIGDSNTAALEVDDDKTVPALLEARLRHRGAPTNLLNLGVRGYGTDQAVLRALSLRQLQPTQIIYLFTNNDLFDNNLLRRPRRKYGKGVFLRRRGESTFATYNYPVPNYPERYVGLIALDQQCDPVIHEAVVRAEPSREASARVPEWFPKYFFTYRALRLLRWGSSPSWIGQVGVDPYKEITEHGIEWHDRFYLGFLEKGPLRNRCPEYFEAQMTHLLSMLRMIESVQKVYVVQFPDADVLPDLVAGLKLQTVEMFSHLQSRKTIDGYLNLGARLVEAGLSYKDFSCQGDDWHFCEKGMAWMAEEIDKAFGNEITQAGTRWTQ